MNYHTLPLLLTMICITPMIFSMEKQPAKPLFSEFKAIPGAEKFIVEPLQSSCDLATYCGSIAYSKRADKIYKLTADRSYIVSYDALVAAEGGTQEPSAILLYRIVKPHHDQGNTEPAARETHTGLIPPADASLNDACEYLQDLLLKHENRIQNFFLLSLTRSLYRMIGNTRRKSSLLCLLAHTEQS